MGSENLKPQFRAKKNGALGIPGLSSLKHGWHQLWGRIAPQDRRGQAARRSGLCLNSHVVQDRAFAYINIKSHLITIYHHKRSMKNHPKLPIYPLVCIPGMTTTIVTII